jgi:hypothetical protein
MGRHYRDLYLRPVSRDTALLSSPALRNHDSLIKLIRADIASSFVLNFY